jgi:hypothetical protein
VASRLRLDPDYTYLLLLPYLNSYLPLGLEKVPKPDPGQLLLPLPVVTQSRVGTVVASSALSHTADNLF